MQTAYHGGRFVGQSPDAPSYYCKGGSISALIMTRMYWRHEKGIRNDSTVMICRKKWSDRKIPPKPTSHVRFIKDPFQTRDSPKKIHYLMLLLYLIDPSLYPWNKEQSARTFARQQFCRTTKCRCNPLRASPKFEKVLGVIQVMNNIFWVLRQSILKTRIRCGPSILDPRVVALLFATPYCNQIR
jgi:hypothetical protein